MNAFYLILPSIIVSNVFAIDMTKVSDLAQKIAKDFTDNVNDDAKTEKEKIDILHQLTIKYFDIRSISQFVLGANWKKLNDHQRQRYYHAFENVFVKTLMSIAVKVLKNVTYKINGVSKMKNNGAKIDIFVSMSNKSSVVTIKVREKNGEIKVIDLMVDGISEVIAQKEFFNEMFKQAKDDPDVFINNINGNKSSGIKNQVGT